MIDLRSNGAVAMVLVLAGAGLLAGCADAPRPAESEPPVDVVIPWEAPGIPILDAAATLAGHAQFVRAHPNREGNSPAHLAARQALAKEFDSMGLELWRQEFTSSIEGENICAIQWGQREPDVWIIVGAHYDSTATPLEDVVQGAEPQGGGQGAYDDGSGTWIVVELARAFSKSPSYYSILYCLFDSEELGLEGSRAVHSAMIKGFPHRVTETLGMVDLDMYGIAWPVRAPIALKHNSDAAFDRLDEHRKTLGVPDDMFVKAGRSLGRSDYQHWIHSETVTLYFSSDFDYVAIPTPVPNPAPVPAIPVVSYPFWHRADTVETMTLMAGGPDMLERGFETSLNIAAYALDLLANRPDLALRAEA